MVGVFFLIARFAVDTDTIFKFIFFKDEAWFATSGTVAPDRAKPIVLICGTRRSASSLISARICQLLQRDRESCGQGWYLLPHDGLGYRGYFPQRCHRPQRHWLFDALHFRQFLRHLKVHDVAGVVLMTIKTPAPSSAALMASKIWSGVGEVNTAPHTAADNIPFPTKPA